MSESLVTSWMSLMWSAIWQSSVLFILVWAGCRLLPKVPAKIKSVLWWLIAAKLVLSLIAVSGIPLKILPAEKSPLAFLNHRLDLLAPDIKVPAKPANFMQVVTEDGPALGPAESAVAPLLGVALFVTWLIGAVTFFGLFVWQWLRARKLYERSVPIENEITGLARELGVMLGLHQTPKLRESVDITSPMVIGVFRPVVLLPTGFDQDLSTDEIRMSVAHELAHIRRWDLSMSLIPALAQIFFFFLPTVWLANRKWETEREAASDALALDVTQSSPADYGRMLMKIVVKDSARNLSPALGATANYHSLKERLLRMKIYSPKSSRVRTASVALIAAGLVLVLPWQISAQTGATARNEVRNGGFEEGASTNWSKGSLPPNADVPVTISLDTQTFKSGKASLKFEKSERRFFPVALMAQQIPYNGKAQKLKLGLWVKAQSAAKFTLAAIMSGAGDGKIEWGAYVGDPKGSTAVTDHDWKYYTSVVAVPSGTKEISLALQMYGPGTVWVDDVMAQYVADDTPVKSAVQDTAEDPEADIKDVSNEERRVGGDARMKYFLIGKGKEPANGYKMLLVMPGGDGSAEFNPFIRRVWKGALPAGYIVCQLVAPKWSEDQFSQIVWPTNKKRWATMKFSTEQFLEGVISDAQKAVKVDPKHIYTLSWSSGGPAAYAASMSSRTIKGSFIAMSIYRPEDLPPASSAKGHAYYLLHSPTDFIKIAQPQKALDELGKAGAKITLDTYEGGHGWHGDVFGMIRKGVDWLEKNSAG